MVLLHPHSPPPLVRRFHCALYGRPCSGTPSPMELSALETASVRIQNAGVAVASAHLHGSYISHLSGTSTSFVIAPSFHCQVWADERERRRRRSERDKVRSWK